MAGFLGHQLKDGLNILKRDIGLQNHSPFHLKVEQNRQCLHQTPKITGNRKLPAKNLSKKYLALEQSLVKDFSNLQNKNLCSVTTISEKKRTDVQYVHPNLDTPQRTIFYERGLDEKSSWKMLGRGTFGIVCEANYKSMHVAAKIIPLRRYNSSIHTLKNERNAIGLCHPNIITVLKVIDEHKDFGLVLMEKCHGTELQKLLDEPSFTISNETKVRFSLDVASALLYCHSRNILHLDVKPRNILVCHGTGVCKLLDFGTSLNLTKQSNRKQDLMVTAIYTAPELLMGEKETPAADVYSFGITMWQIAARKLPHASFRDSEEVIFKVISKNLRPDDTNRQDCYRCLYEKCWNQDPTKRPHFGYIIKELENMIRMCD